MASTRTAAFAVQIATGPLAGRRFVLEDKLEIGRGEGADIQLLDPRVSRSHAMLMDADGCITLIDTLSVNGTWVGPQRISRVELQVGDCFTIGGSMFELAHARPDASPRGRAERKPGTHKPRATMQLDPLDVTTIVGGDDVVPMAAECGGPDDFIALLLDVASFRILRLQHARGELADDKRARYEALSDRFLVRDGDSPVASLARFGVEIPAEVVFSNRRDRVHATRIAELGVDGAKILVQQELAPPQTFGWLSIHLRGGEQTRTLVFTVRVEWTRGTTTELTLCGAPSWG